MIFTDQVCLGTGDRNACSSLNLLALGRFWESNVRRWNSICKLPVQPEDERLKYVEVEDMKSHPESNIATQNGWLEDVGR